MIYRRRRPPMKFPEDPQRQAYSDWILFRRDLNPFNPGTFDYALYRKALATAQRSVDPDCQTHPLRDKLLARVKRHFTRRRPR